MSVNPFVSVVVARLGVDVCNVSTDTGRIGDSSDEKKTQNISSSRMLLVTKHFATDVVATLSVVRPDSEPLQTIAGADRKYSSFGPTSSI